MIYTVTLNPAVDRTVRLTAPFAYGEVNRVLHAVERAGGKGINVARTLHRDNVAVTAYTVLGGKTGQFIADILEQEHIPARWMNVPLATRTNTKIVARDGTVTEYNEIGAPIGEAEIRTFMRALVQDATLEASPPLVLLCGSAPYGVENSIYNYLVTLLHQIGCRVWLDCDGKYLEVAMQAKPDLIKPNLFEFSTLVGHSVKPEDAEAEATALYQKTGVEVLLTMGEDGAVFAGKAGTFFAPAYPPRAEIATTVGAGDHFLAVFAANVFARRMDTAFSLLDAARATALYLSETDLADTILPENYDELLQAALGPMNIYRTCPEKDPLYGFTESAVHPT